MTDLEALAQARGRHSFREVSGLNHAQMAVHSLFLSEFLYSD